MRKKSKLSRIDIVGELSIFTAAVIRTQLLEALATAPELEVDLSKVSEIDSAGIQVMVAAKREAAAQNKALRFLGHSAAVVDILDLTDLAAHFGDPLLIHSQA